MILNFDKPGHLGILLRLLSAFLIISRKNNISPQEYGRNIYKQTVNVGRTYATQVQLILEIASVSQNISKHQ